MKKILRVPLFFTFLVSAGYFLSACCKAECLNAELFISFQNYTKAEADTVVIIGYKSNSNFTVKQNSNVIIKPYAANDTSKSHDFYLIYPDKDFLIRVTSVNKEFKLTDFELANQKCACEHRNVPVLKSFKLNGTAHTDVNNFFLPR